MFSVSPLDRDRFYFRLLLIHSRGCVSFADVKTVDGVFHLTYEAATTTLGLLEDGACQHDIPRRFRPSSRSSASIVCRPICWNFTTVSRNTWWRNRPEGAARAACLNIINQLLGTYGKSLVDFGLPVPDVIEEPPDAVYDAIDKSEWGDSLLQQLNVDQRAVYDRVMAAVLDPRPSTKVFVNGGTGKTMLYSCVMSVLCG
jgi:hypothetical protein